MDWTLIPLALFHFPHMATGGQQETLTEEKRGSVGTASSSFPLPWPYCLEHRTLPHSMKHSSLPLTCVHH